MKCPSCVETVLTMTERAGVEIDYCPTCRGVWLDRGELDKILERDNARLPAPAPAPAPNRGSDYDRPMPAPSPAPSYRRDYDDDDDDDRWKKRKRKGLLGELFDF